MSVLEEVRGPKDVKRFTRKQLKDLADEIRSILVDVTTRNGGHLASNLGVVELTIALHRVFDSPRDKIIFDVSHQTYVHKLLTGRGGEKFLHLRTSAGYCGFSDPRESEHDAFIAGHAGTALSVGLGFAYARDRMPCLDDHHVVVVIGDASLSCGLTLEALNNVAVTTKRLIVIVNDNEFSIDKNVGAISLYLNEIIRSRIYKIVTTACKKILGDGNFGRTVVRYIRNLKRAIKGIFLPTSYFEYYGLRYLGPVDGHDIENMEEVFEFCKTSTTPILVHVKTTKGKGFVPAERAPENFHGVDVTQSHGNLASDIIVPYSEVLGNTLVNLARDDDRVVGITAAMSHGTGLNRLKESIPARYVDVGIAEEHAVTFSGALAKAGMRPVCVIYSTFLQRAFDQIINDVCIQNLPVVFCLSRAGVSAKDGVTHHGIFDLSYLRLIPSSVVVQPKDGQDLINIIHSAMNWNRPVFVRYPKTYKTSQPMRLFSPTASIALGEAEKLTTGRDVCLIALGNMIELAYSVREQLMSHGKSVGIVNARFVKPLAEATFLSLVKDYKLLVTMEDNVLSGGFGSGVLEFFYAQGVRARMIRIGWPDKFIGHGTSEDILRKQQGISVEEITQKILSSYVEKL